MICSQCNKDLDSKNFLINADKCYKCIYDMKMSLQKGYKKTEFRCKTCNVKFKPTELDKGQQGRRRESYCSLDCAEIAKKEQINNHWMRIGRRKNEVIIF